MQKSEKEERTEWLLLAACLLIIVAILGLDLLHVKVIDEVDDLQMPDDDD